MIDLLRQGLTPSRRDWLRHIAGICGISACGDALAADDSNPLQLPGGACLDYGRSFIGHRGSQNSVRFWIESRTLIIDEQAGTRHEFFQCASCKSEDTFVEKNLFKPDNYDFLPIIGREQVILFRRGPRVTASYRDVRPRVAVWGEPVFHLHPAEPAVLLDTAEKINAAGAAGLPIVTQTELRNADTGLRAVIECPAKTLNLNPEKNQYQVDTGPVAYPDLSRRYDSPIEHLQLAFIAFNAPDFTDFVVEQPLPLVNNDQEVAEVFHYTKPFSLSAKNVWIAQGKL